MDNGQWTEIPANPNSNLLKNWKHQNGEAKNGKSQRFAGHNKRYKKEEVRMEFDRKWVKIK